MDEGRGRGMRKDAKIKGKRERIRVNDGKEIDL
jgi:hypothetical protein